MLGPTPTMPHPTPTRHTHTHTHTWVEEPKDCARAGQLYSHKWVSRGWSSTRPPGGSEQPSAPEGAPRPRRGDRRAGRQQHAFARAGQHVRIEKRPQTSTRATPRAPPVPHSTRPIRPTMPHPTPTRHTHMGRRTERLQQQKEDPHSFDIEMEIPIKRSISPIFKRIFFK
jgi:hypothetical protein